MDVLTILDELISRPSVTPNDCGCQEYIANLMKQYGFHVQDFSYENVSNVWITWGASGPLFVFAGHTDVVSAGNEMSWLASPFKLTNINSSLYGRGVADMKGAVAAMVSALIEFVQKYKNANLRLGLLLTSAEEGDDFLKGTPYVMERLAEKNIKIDYCVVGEPSSTNQLGDTIKVGRRGSLTGSFEILGKQGHVAYAHLADNPVNKLNAFLSELLSFTWDNGNKDFPATSLQVVELRSGGLGSNVIPPDAYVQFNLRFSNEISVEFIQNQVRSMLKNNKIKYKEKWLVKGLPFYTQNKFFLSKMQQAINSVTGVLPQPSTDGGTSDARFIAPFGIPVIEFGLLNNSIHQINENIHQDHLEKLKNVYLKMCEIIQ